MAKLGFEFAAELPIKQSQRDIISLTALAALAGQRAIAFGCFRVERMNLAP
jgi:hypothetical protein